MQKQAFYEHPHEHRGFGVLEKSVAGLAEHGLEAEESFLQVNLKSHLSLLLQNSSG